MPVMPNPDIKGPKTDFKKLFDIFRKQKLIEVDKLNEEIRKSNEEMRKSRKKYDDLMTLVMELLNKHLDTATVNGLPEDFNKELERIINE